MIDILVIGAERDTVFLLHPKTDAGTDFLNDNIAGAQCFGTAIIVEHRYMQPILERLHESDLEIAFNNGITEELTI